MLFSSLNFMGIFLPLVLIIYFITKNREARNWILLAASLVFYAWGRAHLDTGIDCTEHYRLLLCNFAKQDGDTWQEKSSSNCHSYK